MSTTSAQPAHRPLSRRLPAPVRSLLARPSVERRVAAVLRSSVVRESPAFALRELTGRPSRHVYTVRENGLRALIEHGHDAHALDQAFYQHAHEPPAEVVALLLGLDRPVRALDLGANVGMWGLWLHGRFAVERVLALEPDPENVSRHRRQIELNDLGGSWEVLEAAAVTTDGPVYFTVGKATNGRVTDASGEGVESVPGRDTFALLDGLDLLKIDIEGGEWAILADPRAAELQVPVVMLEYHAHDAPSDTHNTPSIAHTTPSDTHSTPSDTHSTPSDTHSTPSNAHHAPSGPQTQARSALERAGYTVEAGAETEPGFGVVWGWKPACALAST